MNTLRYAHRAKRIKNKPVVHMVCLWQSVSVTNYCQKVNEIVYSYLINVVGF